MTALLFDPAADALAASLRDILVTVRGDAGGGSGTIWSEDGLVITNSHVVPGEAATVTLPDGQPCLVRLPAVYGRRLVELFTFEEIHALVTLIAHNAINPVEGPLCRK